jgi:hypothetical protein
VCKNGTQAVGCGPQEEFRACADVAVTDADGTADNRRPDSTNEIAPLPPPKQPSSGTDWNREPDAAAGDNPARVVVIIFAALITTGLLFLVVFLYYYKAKQPLKAFIKERKGMEWPSLPAFFRGSPLKVKSSPLWTTRVQESWGRINWPLASSGSKLPSSAAFIQRSPVMVAAAPKVAPPPPPPSFAGRGMAPARPGQSGPVPPPRTRRSSSRCSSPGLSTASSKAYQPPQQQPTMSARLATIQPRRPPAPPPAAPPPPLLSRGGPLEISAPTEVTINGVSVNRPSPMAHTAPSGPRPSSSGIICAARPALILSDIPDSSLEVSLPPPPPPLPTCPPPDSLSLENNVHSTDA